MTTTFFAKLPSLTVGFLTRARHSAKIEIQLDVSLDRRI